MFVAFSKLSFN